MKEDFGAYLKSERELRGVPLEEVSANTKIHIRFLQALENNQFDKLPGEVFTKGYIRSFAKVIGFDEHEMLSVYDETISKPSPNIKNKSTPVKEKISVDKNITFRLVFLIIILTGVGWFANILVQNFTGNSKKPESSVLMPDQKKIKGSFVKILPDLNKVNEDDSPSSKEIEKFSRPAKPEAGLKKQVEKPSDNLPVKPIQEVKNFLPTETKEDGLKELKANSDITPEISEKENIGSVPSLATGSDIPLKLTIRVKDNVWFNITVDESRGEDFILPKGGEKIFYGKNNFRVTLGNRNLVDLKLNDKILNLPDGDENKVVREFLINSQLIE